jgi:anti-anti-sigma factor
MSLRLRLMLLILAPTLILFAAAGLFAYQSLFETLYAEAQHEAQHQAEDLARQVGQALTIDAQVPALLATVSPSYGSPEAYYAALHSAIPTLLAQAELFNLGVFFEPGAVGERSYAIAWYLRELSGEIYELQPNFPGSADYSPTLPIYDYPRQSWFKVGRAASQLVWTEPYFDFGGANIAMVTVTVPVQHADQVIGVATTDIPLDKVRALLTGVELSPNSYVMLVSSQGRFIAHERNPELELSRSLGELAVSLSSPDLRQLDQQVASGSTGRLTIRDPWTGVESWATHVAVPETGWSVVMVTPLTDAFAPIAAFQRMFLLAGALLFTTVAGVIWLVATRFLRPIQTLTIAAERVAAGERGAVQLKIRRRDELGRLASSFEHMAEEIGQAQTSLEATVQLRTQELQSALAAQRAQAQALQASLDEVQQQKALIAALSTPVIPVRHDTLVVPIVGALDGGRAEQLIMQTLTAIQRQRARTVILDVTGLPMLDEAAARTLLRLSEAARLVGARIVLVGITPEVAQTMVALGLSLQGLHTLSTLEAAVEMVLR